jgi:hypothetical protein
METGRIYYSKRFAFTGKAGFHRFTAQAMRLVRAKLQAINALSRVQILVDARLTYAIYLGAE